MSIRKRRSFFCWKLLFPVILGLGLLSLLPVRSDLAAAARFFAVLLSGISCGVLLHECCHLLGGLLAGYQIISFRWGAGEKLFAFTLGGIQFGIHEQPMFGGVMSKRPSAPIIFSWWRESLYIFAPLIIGAAGAVSLLVLDRHFPFGRDLSLFLFATCTICATSFFPSHKTVDRFIPGAKGDSLRARTLLKGLFFRARSAGPRALEAIRIWATEPRRALELLDAEWSERESQNLWCWPLSITYLSAGMTVGFTAAVRAHDLPKAGIWAKRLWSRTNHLLLTSWPSPFDLFQFTVKEEVRRLEAANRAEEAQALVRKAAESEEEVRRLLA